MRYFVLSKQLRELVKAAKEGIISLGEKKSGLKEKRPVKLGNHSTLFLDPHFHFMLPQFYRGGIDGIIEQAGSRVNGVCITNRGNDAGSGICSNKELSYDIFSKTLERTKGLSRYYADVKHIGRFFTYINYKENPQKSANNEGRPLIFVKAQEIWVDEQKVDLMALCTDYDYSSESNNCSLRPGFRTKRDILKSIVDQGGILYYPHPFAIRTGMAARIATSAEICELENIMCGFDFDAIEVFNSYLTLIFQANALAKEFIRQNNDAQRGVASSDGHYDLSLIGKSGIHVDAALLNFDNDYAFRDSLKNAFRNAEKQLVQQYSSFGAIANSLLVLEKKFVQ